MNKTDGSIVIDTTIDDTEFYRKIKEFEKVKDFSIEINPELNSEELQNQIYEAAQELNKMKKLEVMSEDELLKAQMLVEYIEQANMRISELGGQRVIIKGLNDAEENLEKIEENAKKIDLSSFKAQFSELNGSVKKIGNSIEGVTKKVVRWGLAVFSIRSAFRFIRTATSELSSRNEQLATDVEYIRFALASTLAPVIEKIVQLAYRLLYYVGYIAKAWFGINIFANATQKAFESGNKSLKNSNKEAKKLQKTLAGFDEMNVLQDNKSSDSDTGTGGVGTPSFDLSKLQGEVPDWLKWIADHGREIIAILAGIVAGLIALRFGASGLMALGIGLMVAGLVYAVKGLLDYLKNPTWENFGKVIQGIGVFVIGLGAAFLSLPAVIVGVVVLILGTIIKYWNEIKAFLQKGIDWLLGRTDWIKNNLGKDVADIYLTIVALLQGILNGFDTAFKGLKQMFNGIIKFIKGVFTGNWKMAWQGIKDIFTGTFKTIKGIAQSVLSVLGGITVSVAKFIGSTVRDVFKSIINGVLNTIENMLNGPILALNALIGIINKIPKVNIGYLPTINLPRLAKGGIVNMPSKGVPVGGALAGERGQEGVIPLTDSQQMALLGEAIGKYITINANITNTMNGRVISRELQKVQNDSNFAFNR